MKTFLNLYESFSKSIVLLRFILAMLFVSSITNAQVPGDFGAYTNGNWNVPSTWKIYDGNAWATSPVSAMSPDSCNAYCFILTGVTVSLTVSGNATVHNLEINSGGVLSINAGAILNLCGNFTNNGTLIASQGSTIRFIGSVDQTISGSVTGMNSFANLTIDKLAGSGNVSLNADIDVNGNFLTSNATSIFSINRKYMKIGGDFSNAFGSITFTGLGGSTIEFNGATNQNLVNDSGSIKFNDVKMNKAGGKLYLVGPNSSMNIDSTLTLDSGIIVTRYLPDLEVNMLYYLPAALQGNPNASCYIDGKLRRKISNGQFSSPVIPASYDFPVGDSLSPGGYEKANVTFTSATLISSLQATFTPWPAFIPPAAGPLAFECFQETYSNLPIFDNGYWTILRGGPNVNGRHTITLFNTGFTNNVGMGWTVAVSDLTSDPSLTASWRLTGICVLNSTAGATSRELINPSPGVDSTCFNLNYATVQSQNALPVEQLNFKNISGIELYPNPVSSIINYKFSYSENGELVESILDVSGRVVRKEKINVVKGMNQITKRIDDLAPGLYLLRISVSTNESVNLQVQFFKN